MTYILPRGMHVVIGYIIDILFTYHTVKVFFLSALNKKTIKGCLSQLGNE